MVGSELLASVREVWRGSSFGERSAASDANKSKFHHLTNMAVNGMTGSLDRHSSYYDPPSFGLFR